MSKKKIVPLTPAQTQHQEFMISLVSVLSHSDLSNLDLSTFVNEHNAYSALIDNYEISIARTPVYACSNRLGRTLGVGRWVFTPGEFERYEVRIFENSKKMRLRKGVRMYGRENVKFNTLLEYGTMATDRGYYLCSRYELENTVNADNMYYNQNKHLFIPSKQLYNVLDAEYLRRASEFQDCTLSNAEFPGDARAKLLETVRNKFALKKTK